MFMMFYDKKCNIYKRTKIKENFVEKEKFEMIHENLSCDFFSSGANSGSNSGELYKYEDEQKYKLILTGNIASDMSLWDRIEVIDPTAGNFGFYEIVGNPQIYRLPSGIVENITLILKKSVGVT